MFTNILRGQIIDRSVGNNMENKEEGVRTVKRALNLTGHFDDEADRAPHGIITRQADEAIKSFQTKRNLKVDGILKPGGETEEALFSDVSRTVSNNMSRLLETEKAFPDYGFEEAPLEATPLAESEGEGGGDGNDDGGGDDKGGEDKEDGDQEEQPDEKTLEEKDEGQQEEQKQEEERGGCEGHNAQIQEQIESVQGELVPLYDKRALIQSEADALRERISILSEKKEKLVESMSGVGEGVLDALEAIDALR